MSLSKPWYRFFKEPYSGNDPYFFEPEKLNWVKTVESNFELIKKEMLEIISNRNDYLKPYRFHESGTGKPEWQTLAFTSWGFKFHRKAKLCPETMKILENIPGFVSASLSLLEPESSIPEHRGDTNAIVRSHLGIIIPGQLPECGFQCGEDKRSWKEGKVLPFCDAQPHSAWNKTKEKRYVMILDVMRPEYLHLKNKVCSTIIATHLLLALDQRIRFYEKSSGMLLRVFASPLSAMIRILLPLKSLTGL